MRIRIRTTLIKMQLSPSASIGTSRGIPTTTIIITITTASTRTQHTTQIIVTTTRRRRRNKWTRRRDGDSSGDRFWPTAAIPLRKQFRKILLVVLSIRITDPGSKKGPDPDPQQRIYRMYDIFNTKNCYFFLGDMIRDVHPGFGFFPSRTRM
jgi:hypothetical protein